MILQGRHHRYAPFYLGVLGAVVTAPFAIWLWPPVAIQLTANVFFLVYLALEFFKIPSLTPAYLKKHAASADEPAWIIVLVGFGAVVVAVGSLFVLINKGGSPNILDLGLSLAAVALGWLTIHTMAAFHYAHLYWQPGPRGSTGKSKSAEPLGGLDFPGDGEPGGYDFLYFSLVTGMTAQTSDVAITRTEMRKLNVLHAVVSFFFNTVLVAAAVNVAVSLGS